MIILICWASASQIYAQGTQHPGVPADTNEFHTIFHKGDGTHKIRLGYFVELSAGYTHFGKRANFLPGISGGLILNHHWTVGVTGNFFGSMDGMHNRQFPNDTAGPGRERRSLHGGYGGLLLEYTLFPRSKVHVSFPLIIGGGMVSESRPLNPPDSAIFQDGFTHHFYHGEHFFVLEPGVKLELNVIKKLRVGLGISYRYSPERDRRVTSPESLNQLTARLSIRFGKF